MFVFAFCSSVATRTTPALDRLNYISKRPLSSIVFLYTLSGLELTESYFTWKLIQANGFTSPSLLYYLVYCKYFNVLILGFQNQSRSD